MGNTTYEQRSSTAEQRKRNVRMYAMGGLGTVLEWSKEKAKDERPQGVVSRLQCELGRPRQVLLVRRVYVTLEVISSDHELTKSSPTFSLVTNSVKYGAR